MRLETSSSQPRSRGLQDMGHHRRRDTIVVGEREMSGKSNMGQITLLSGHY
jgi:hypothetical protein